MVVVLNGIGSRVVLSPICSFKLIFWVRHGELFLFQYIYIYLYHMHGLLLCAFVLYCAKPSPRRSRIPGKPGPWRSVVMIGGVRPQFSIYARETFPFGGFATLSASKMVAERGYTQALPCLDTPLTV